MTKKRVLIVDDSISTARQLQKILEDSGSFEVAGHAKNGIEGIKLFTTLNPDVICMDLVMPEMDGLQAIRTLVGLNRDAKILVISSAGGVSDKVMEALRFGAKNVINKPFEPQAVIDILNSL